MDKIVCEICGTSYPEMSEQCPICGYAKPVAPVKTPDSENGGSYRHVKGGRFSNANVRRRNEEKGIPMPDDNSDDEEQTVKKGSNLVLGIIAIVLLLGLIAVLLWFIIDIAGERFAMLDTIPEQTSQLQPQLQIQPSVIEFGAAGDVSIIQASVVPVDNEAFFLFESDNDRVATVDEFGTVTAVGEGETFITVTYGEMSDHVIVTCNFSTTTESTEADVPFTLNRTDFTLNAKGDKWDLCGASVTVAKNQITWTSDDESVAKIEAGVVEAVGPGSTMVHAQYGDYTVSCQVRCNFEVDNTDATITTEEDDTTVGGTYKISHTDVTISVGESFQLQLRDENKKAVDVEWSASEEGYVTIEGNKITGVKSTPTKGITVAVTYEGKTYSCTIRVKR